MLNDLQKSLVAAGVITGTAYCLAVIAIAIAWHSRAPAVVAIATLGMTDLSYYCVLVGVNPVPLAHKRLWARAGNYLSALSWLFGAAAGFLLFR